MSQYPFQYQYPNEHQYQAARPSNYYYDMITTLPIGGNVNNHDEYPLHSCHDPLVDGDPSRSSYHESLGPNHQEWHLPQHQQQQHNHPPCAESPSPSSLLLEAEQRSDHDGDNDDDENSFDGSGGGRGSDYSREEDNVGDMDINHDSDAVSNSSADDDDDDDRDHDQDRRDFHNVSRETVIQRIEDLILSQSILEPLAANEVPTVSHPHHKTFLHNTHCRILTSMFLVADFCHELLLSHRTTTIREVYYHFVTHFRNQAECDKAIWDLAATLRVPRAALGLVASPKGWCCGCLELYDQETGDLMWNGRVLDIHGMAITMNLLQKATVKSTDARCILVIEKEGVYTRLSEDKFFQYHYPCILVTGKGFPDIATRQWVQHLQRVLHLPVYGLCDGNPYGISVLHTYQYDQKAGVAYYGCASSGGGGGGGGGAGAAGTATTATSQPLGRGRGGGGRTNNNAPFHVKWLGLRPSQLGDLALPPSVFQKLTDLDKKRLASLQNETHLFQQQGNVELRMQELQEMEHGGRKIELEALNWLGMDFLCQWLQNMLERYEEDVANGRERTSSIII